MRQARADAPGSIATALSEFDFRVATGAIAGIGDAGNRYIEAVRPWELAKAERTDPTVTAKLDTVLGELIDTCRDIAVHLTPFLPAAAVRIAAQVGVIGVVEAGRG